MKHISDYVSGRDNNFNLIRLLAAGTVVFAHSYIVAIGDRNAGPLIEATGHDLGYHAVNVFFSASGFLIAQSWLRSQSAPDFLAGRVMRLWPALALCTLFLAFAMGPLLTVLPLSAYLSSPETYAFVPRVMSLLRTDTALPGVVTPLPDDVGIDAPLWTLKYEVMCYCAVLAFGLLGLFSPRRFWRAVGPLMLLLVVASLLPLARDKSHPWDHVIRFGLCFGFGVIACVQASRIPLTLWAVASGLLLCVLLRETAFYEMAFCLFTAYTTMWVAFVPGFFLRSFNRLGDYSCGLYIFAYPIQVWLIHRWPGLTPLGLFARASIMALALSVASWRFVERPSLAHKAALAARLGHIMHAAKDRLWSLRRRTADSSGRAEA